MKIAFLKLCRSTIKINPEGLQPVPLLCVSLHALFSKYTVEPSNNEEPRDWQNVFAITRFPCFGVHFHIL